MKARPKYKYCWLTKRIIKGKEREIRKEDRGQSDIKTINYENRGNEEVCQV